MTTLYDRNQEGQVVTVPNMRPSYKWAGGGFVSTAEDLVRFGLAHLKSNFFEHETLAMMFTSQKTVDGKETGVGIGWMISRDPWGRRIVFHNGRQLGARSVLVVYPADNLAIAILSNLTGIPQLIEGVAVSIADPFIRIINGDACQFADEELIGNYQYLVGMPDNGSRGTLTISELMGRYSYQGSMTTSPNAKISQIPITSLVVYKSGISAIVAAPEGLLPIKLKTTPTGFSGFLTFHKGRNPQDISIEINRQ
ncbi:serine hydrolase [candidate division KSB1 bacterium]|nr:beta-lactamase family protein [candidate division KSB1 bacterium]NIR68902.1 beta-lactamase family protein [candidate division KSB1 bacterium]NIU24677.1 beta-lactamase family protein [candidate division KSB1 bacterium]NIU89842.1 serine hydrolase [candidate division KSB1 bacterium]NIV91956.1 serine hydrolase [candidate division KSB1 bacterium]